MNEWTLIARLELIFNFYFMLKILFYFITSSLKPSVFLTIFSNNKLA